jgi:hypothetical protein
MKFARIAAFLITCSIIPATSESAVTTISASKDNTIFQNPATNSAGGAAGIFSGANGAGSPRRGLIAFDIAGNLPPGAYIQSAVLGMYLGNAPNSNPQNVELHRLAVNWGEGTAGSSSPTVSGAGNGFDAGVGDATWNTPTSGSGAWTNPGATGDFIAAASATTAVSGPVDTSFTWNSAGLLDDVRGWYTNSATNFGWLLFNAGEGSSQSVKAFYSRSATQNASGGTLNPEFRPRLIITYIPEPATITLFVLAGPLAILRRRR